MIDPGQLLDYVIVPALARLAPVIPHTEVAARLVLGTALVESGLTALDQRDKAGKPGPAYGLWQIEKLTFDDHLSRAPKSLVSGLYGYMSWKPGIDDLHWNLRLGAAMCRLIYWHAPESLPSANDFEAMARLWKLRYNTPLGAGTVERAIPFFKLACSL